MTIVQNADIFVDIKMKMVAFVLKALDVTISLSLIEFIAITLTYVIMNRAARTMAIDATALLIVVLK